MARTQVGQSVILEVYKRCGAKVAHHRPGLCWCRSPEGRHARGKPGHGPYSVLSVSHCGEQRYLTLRPAAARALAAADRGELVLCASCWPVGMPADLRAGAFCCAGCGLPSLIALVAPVPDVVNHVLRQGEVSGELVGPDDGGVDE